MSATSEGATGPVGRVALGLRFELVDNNGKYVGAFLREDVKGAAVPRSGEHLARGTFSEAVQDLVGLTLVVDHVDHYLDVPQSKEWDPLAMVVVKVRDVSGFRLNAAQGRLEAEGWSVHLSPASE